MEAVATALEGLALAEWLRYSRWGYATVNALHVFGIALLVGAILPLNLRLLGLWPSVEFAPLYGMLSRVAATGLALAILSGMLLFAVRATEYAALGLFIAKISLVATGVAHAAVYHCSGGPEQLSRPRQRLLGAFSLLLWPAVLLCGRFLAFA